MADALTSAQNAFLADYAGYAQLAAQQTGIPWETIIAQWADETGWGTSTAFVAGHNFAGVSPGGRIATYPDVATGLAAYISTLLDPVYATVRNAGAQGPVAAAQALGASPWAASHYNASGGGPGSDLVTILAQAGLDTSQGADVLTAYVPGTNLHIPGTAAGGSLAPPSYVTDTASSVVNDLISALERPALSAVFLLLAVGLVAAGVWHTVAPTVKPAVNNLTQNLQGASGKPGAAAGGGVGEAAAAAAL